MEKILTIDEAIELLKREKEKGSDTVIYIVYDNVNCISRPGIKIPINKGIKIITETKTPIGFMESKIMKTLTSFNSEKVQIISF